MDAVTLARTAREKHVALSLGPELWRMGCTLPLIKGLPLSPLSCVKKTCLASFFFFFFRQCKAWELAGLSVISKCSDWRWPWGLFAGRNSWVRPASVTWARKNRQLWMREERSRREPDPTPPGTGNSLYVLYIQWAIVYIYTAIMIRVAHVTTLLYNCMR